MKGVTGDVVCEYGGMINVQVIKANGDIVRLRTPSYYNPHQHVRLFSPQYHFSLMPKQQGSLTLSWAKVCLTLPKIGMLPVFIDPDSYMSLLQCFHDTDKTLQALANPCMTDESNPNLTTIQKLRLRLHFKVGHVGFDHLWHIIRKFGLFGTQGRVAFDDTKCPDPLCSSCITGGMQHQKVDSNQRSNAPTTRGILSCEQLLPRQRVFSDHYVSSVVGKNFNGRNGRQNPNSSYRGGTIFYDAATSYMSIHHQLGFTSHETVCSLLAFEREASEANITVTGYNIRTMVFIRQKSSL